MNKFLEYAKKIPVWLLLVGMAGAVILLWPEWSSKPAAAPVKEAGKEEYAKGLETELMALISQIEGVSEVSLMVTLEGGTENVYATEKRSNVNLLSDSLNPNQKRVENQNDNEDKYIIVKGSDGTEAPVLLKRLAPVVKGVAIVCRGSENDVVRQKIIETVSVALNLPSNRVSVVGK